MRIAIAAIGRLKDGPDRTLFKMYMDRLEALGKGLALIPVPVDELPESRASNPRTRKDDEASRLLKVTAGADIRIVLDERGKALTSAQFADLIVGHRDDGVRILAFLAGGADGHGLAVQKAARLAISLGKMTLPHGLARIVLAEQLYRAATIIAGHPYHRQ